MAKSRRRSEPSELESLSAFADPLSLLDAVLAYAPVGAVILRAPDGKVACVSTNAALIMGRSPRELEGGVLGRGPWMLRASDATRHLSEEEMPWARALQGEETFGFEALATAAGGETIPCSLNAGPIWDARGALIGAVCLITDLTSRKTLERKLEDEAKQRDVLVRELTHRVKNHLQIMSGLVSVEARDSELTAANLARIMQGRLRTLATVYDCMIKAGRGARIRARRFIQDVCAPYATNRVAVEVMVEPFDLTLSSEQASPIGMLVNEAVSNSYKHAFPDGVGRIWVALRRQKAGRLHLEICDDGVGWTSRQEARRVSHGIELMRAFARQLRSELELGHRPGGGALLAAELPEHVE